MVKLQERILSSETRYLPFGPYLWRVLKVEDDRALLITEDIIIKHPYNNRFEDMTWETCSLREYLNFDFPEVFSAEELYMIKEYLIKNPDLPAYGENGVNTTKDKFFLLSFDEAKSLFVNDVDRR